MVGGAVADAHHGNPAGRAFLGRPRRFSGHSSLLIARHLRLVPKRVIIQPTRTPREAPLFFKHPLHPNLPQLVGILPQRLQ